MNGTASTVSVAAGSTFGLTVSGNPANFYHPGVRQVSLLAYQINFHHWAYAQVLNVYMAKAPSSVSGWTASGAVWFKVYQISAVTDGGSTITFPSEGKLSQSL